MKTARWKIGTTLVEVVKATVEHIDNPDIDYSVNLGELFSLKSFLFILLYRYSQRIYGK
jgi:hypothetical protein